MTFALFYTESTYCILYSNYFQMKIYIYFSIKYFLIFTFYNLTYSAIYEKSLFSVWRRYINSFTKTNFDSITISFKYRLIISFEFICREVQFTRCIFIYIFQYLVQFARTLRNEIFAQIRYLDRNISIELQ